MRSPAQAWRAYQPTRAQLLWLCAASVVATLILGFGPGGWVSGASAQKMADEAATASRQQLAAAVCAEDFLGAANARERLAKLRDTHWWHRGEVVAAGGWATMPGDSEASSTVAALCATRLAEQAEASARGTPLSATAR
jgi:hypothetical protein